MGSNSSRTSTTTTEDSSTTSSTTPGTTTAAVCTQDGNECENGASCVLDPVSPANNFCKCVNGYFGKFCKGKHSDNNSSTINPVLPNQESSPSSTTASSPATSSPTVNNPTASNPTANNDSSSSTTASKPITSNVANANEYDDDMFIMPTYNDDDSPNPIRNPNKGNSNLDDDEKAMWEITGNPKGDMWIIYEIVIPVVGAVLLIV